ncbi:Hypothetical protein, putative [Bodo saltans]|uniref:Uncharacterized protein n=1 Tax=Bodo saltans TaxID=75058 RepID=A0A0S4J2Q2_BODSA|nr:Hypothetical protein, putative [Bodo saltans]|eukprot:CUG06343.1 Hypothetical protein, putative [Bodo saltans]
MSVERGGTQLAITSAERCSPRAQLHLQRLLEGSPPRRLRFHAGSGVFSSSPIHETGSVTTRTGPSPLANVSFYEWCCDEQQCLIKAEERARQALADETFSGTWKDFAAQTHQLLKWFLKEYAGAKDVLATVLPPLATIGNSKEVESQSTSSGEKSSAESTAALQHGNSTFSDLVKRAVLTANEEHIRCTTAMQAVIDIQRRMDAFCAEAMEDRDALVAALRDGESRYAALMEGSQDAVHASRCAADEADFWEEAATARDTVLENISRELGALLAEHHHHGESTKKRRAQRIETKSRNANNEHENAITEPELSNVPSGEENIEKEDEYEEETPLLASLREVPACATAVMDGPRKWSLLLSHKLNTITTMYKEAQARSSIYEGFGSGARELAQDFFAAETAVSEALTDTVALLDAKQRHREMLEGKLRDAQLALEQVKEQSRKESSLRDDEVTALWDLLVRGQPRCATCAGASERTIAQRIFSPR